MKRILMLAAALLLCGCDSDVVKVAKGLLEDTLKDPDSVIYRNVRETSGDVVCGEYNAKNSYGAYAGFSPFASFHGIVYTELDVSDITLLCGDRAGKVYKYLYSKAEYIYRSDRMFSACLLANKTAKLHNDENPGEYPLQIIECK